jgi:aerotaxis receptor
MRINEPVTGRERTYSDDVQLISTTNLKGVITYANQHFAEVAGFTRDELIGQPHNLVRHPDMPEAAFADLWTHLKANKPWMGLVKNRCRNGDHYWVNAYVMPMFKDGEIIGYESVRSKPAAAAVARADRIYKALREGRRAGPRFTPRRTTQVALCMLGVLLPVAAAGIWASGMHPVAVAGAALSAALCPVLASVLMRPLRELAARSRRVYDNAVTSQVVSGRTDEIGQIDTALQVLEARVRTVTGRLTEVAGNLKRLANDTRTSAEHNESSVDLQRRETEQVATAINEMSATVQEIARNTADAKSRAEDAQVTARTGNEVVRMTTTAIETLAREVEEAATTVTQLGEKSKDIGMVVNVIRDIAEQTNLLALNAAIEAARAGEYGRGFAVVADEVRTLASNTQNSTRQINDIIEALRNGATSAADTMTRGQARTVDAVRRAQEAGEALAAIAGAVQGITDINVQVATAVEEQAHVSEEISRNVTNINTSTESLSASAKDTTRHSAGLLSLVMELEDMTSRFSRKAG